MTRRISTFAAILAITAWANVQITACCWSFSGPHKAVAAIETSSMQPDHACCHKQTVATTPVSPLPAGTVALHANHNTCGGQHEAPAVQSNAPSLDLVAVASVSLHNENQNISSSFLSVTPVRDTGPPRYLALQRFLI